MTLLLLLFAFINVNCSNNPHDNNPLDNNPLDRNPLLSNQLQSVQFNQALIHGMNMENFLNELAPEKVYHGKENITTYGILYKNDDPYWKQFIHLSLYFFNTFLTSIMGLPVGICMAILHFMLRSSVSLYATTVLSGIFFVTLFFQALVPEHTHYSFSHGELHESYQFSSAHPTALQIALFVGLPPIMEIGRNWRWSRLEKQYWKQYGEEGLLRKLTLPKRNCFFRLIALFNSIFPIFLNPEYAWGQFVLSLFQAMDPESILLVLAANIYIHTMHAPLVPAANYGGITFGLFRALFEAAWTEELYLKQGMI